MARVTCMLCFAFAVVGVISISGGVSANCQNAWMQTVTNCEQYFVKKFEVSGPPSEDCCDEIRGVSGVDTPCFCSHVDEQALRVLDMSKVVSAFQICGRPLAHGSKCGLFNFPMA